ncbi:hypothetical protein [Alysiella crassa]|uniref:hypothetical protein n=1 Tax=Alysiella crassa TaxID=153491 RepID=UPI001FD18E91|nr:hypothetical protein [Alysiella crassa]UOP06917.1 hypothetical protein LVJ80_14735 [Alysiella crassa]
MKWVFRLPCLVLGNMNAGENVFYSRRTEKAVRRCQRPYVLFVHGGRCRLVLHFHFYDYINH